jgi:hypothetical protein
MGVALATAPGRLCDGVISVTGSGTRETNLRVYYFTLKLPVAASLLLSLVNYYSVWMRRS